MRQNFVERMCIKNRKIKKKQKQKQGDASSKYRWVFSLQLPIPASPLLKPGTSLLT